MLQMVRRGGGGGDILSEAVILRSNAIVIGLLHVLRDSNPLDRVSYVVCAQCGMLILLWDGVCFWHAQSISPRYISGGTHFCI